MVKLLEQIPLLGILGQNQSVGLDIGTKTIKVVALKGSPGHYKLTHYAMTPTPPDTILDGRIKDPDHLSLAITQAFSMADLKARKAHTTVSSSNVFVRHFSIPKLSKRDMESAIMIQAESSLPVPLSELIIDYSVYGSAEEDTEKRILLVAAARDIVKDLSETMELSGLIPQSIGICAQADFRALSAQIADETRPEDFVVICNLRSSNIIFSIFQEGILQKIRVLRLSDSIDEIAEEVNRSLDYYLYENRTHGSGRLYFLGSPLKIEELLRILKDRTSPQVAMSKGNPLMGIELPQGLDPDAVDEFCNHYVTAIGLAMKGLVR